MRQYHHLSRGDGQYRQAHRLRSLIFVGATCLALVVVFVLTLMLGDLGLSFADLTAMVTGDLEPKTSFVLQRLRGPRVLTALCAGALLGLAGALFQTITRNPLGSPDVIGIGAGAGAGVACMTVIVPTLAPGFGSAIGAMCAAALVYFASGKGFRSATRLVIVGIGVAALASAVTQYIVSVHLRDAAQQLAAYLVGSLNAANAQSVAVAGLALMVVLPLALLYGNDVTMLAMGDEAAAGIGVDPERTRVIGVSISIVATAVAVGVVGPVAFVSLTAPQIARRILNTSDVSIVASALTGALVMSVADLAAQQVSLFAGLPVGVLTLGVGGVYLGYLLVRQHQKGSFL